MVVEQGAVIDRIDYNMEMTLINVQNGNKQLSDAKERMEKGCAAKLIKILFSFNLVLFFLLILKFRD